MAPTLCLNMIVKDESHIIENTLEMLCSKMKFHYWVICDTGSSDNTRDIIIDFFNKKNIPGELHCDKWVDFGHNRTLALERAFKKTDLLLVFDADDEIHGTINIPNEILFDEYHLKFGAPKSGMNYTRTQIINNHKRFKYLSVLHEFISCQEPVPARMCILDGDYYLVSGRSGSRNKDPNKYLKDAIVLENAHADAVAKGDDLYKRYAFYCANSYRDCGRYEDAIKWYKITLSQDNWSQEKYVSCLYMYECCQHLNKKEEGFYYLVKAFSYDNERVECLYPLVVHYCCENMNEVAYSYFQMVKMTVPQNNAGKLFVDTDKAGFYLPYYMIIVADRLGNRECGIRMYEIIFSEKHRTFSVWHLRNLMFNLRFFIHHVKPDDVNKFASLANEYLKFVIENGVPANTFDDLSIEFKPSESVDMKEKVKEKAKEKSRFKTSRNILFYTGYCNHHWNYSQMKLGALGGSEKAVAHLSKELGLLLGGAEKGMGMTIYVAGDVKSEELSEFNLVYVTLNDLPNLLKKTEFHTVICSRYISFLEIYGSACSFHQFFIWAHDTCLLAYGCNLTDGAVIDKWAECIDGCVCQTQWHANRYIELYPSLKTKMFIINNGIDLELFPASRLKQKEKFAYTSRTERGVARILELWPQIVEVMPNATLAISTYEAFPCNDEERRIQARIEFLNREFPNNRIEHLGKLNPTQLYQLMSTTEYWLYPTNWPETSCITAMEMLMSEVICLYHPLAGLTDTMNGCGIQIAPGSEINALREIVHDEERKDALRKQGRLYAEGCSWEKRAQKWKETIIGINDVKPLINVVFSIGFRCYSVDFLNHFKLRKFSSPFDHMIIDFETSLKIINNKFDNYLNDVVLFNRNARHVQLCNGKNTTEIDNKFHKLLEKPIGYMAHDFGDVNLCFNQNYLDDCHGELNNNLYHWNRICLFRHYNVSEAGSCQTIQRRCDRFNSVVNEYNETIALFYITKIVNCENIVEYMNNIVQLKKQNDIKFFIIMIINCDNLEDNEYYDEANKCLFITKKVENYETQYAKYETENDVKHLNYEKEFSVISKYFTLNLIEMDDV